MKDLITKVEELRDKFKSHYALEENAYGRACDDVIELLQNLQQTQCKTLLPPIDEAGAIAVTICETLILEPKLTAQEQSFFVAGFQECVKYLGGK